MNAYVITVVRGDEAKREGDSVVIKGNDMSALYKFQRCHRGERIHHLRKD